MKRRAAFDTKDPAFLAMLAEQTQENELAIRMAMRSEFPNVAGDRAWTARIDALREELALDTKGLADLLKRSSKLTATIRDAMGPKPGKKR